MRLPPDSFGNGIMFLVVRFSSQM